MNREQAKQLLPIIQAFADGSELQVHDTMDGQWLDIKDPWFNDGPERYRVKPKPLEGWFVVDRDNAVRISGERFDDRKSATDAMDGFDTAYGPLRVVYMREVTE